MRTFTNTVFLCFVALSVRGSKAEEDADKRSTEKENILTVRPLMDAEELLSEYEMLNEYAFGVYLSSKRFIKSLNDILILLYQTSYQYEQSNVDSNMQTDFRLISNETKQALHDHTENIWQNICSESFIRLAKNRICFDMSKICSVFGSFTKLVDIWYENLKEHHKELFTKISDGRNCVRSAHDELIKNIKKLTENELFMNLNGVATIDLQFY